MNEPLYRLEKVGFSYHGGRAVLRDMNLTLHAGERLGLRGANGSGKSTLLRLMVGLLQPDRGVIEAFGSARVREEDFLDVRRRAGLLFQDADDQLFCPTVLEDVAFGPRNIGCSAAESLARARTVLEELRLADLADRVTYHLSGGEKRMVSVATVLAMRPEVLLLDEPMTGLDEATGHRLVETLDALPQALLVVSHDHSLLKSLNAKELYLCDGVLRGS